ncbi:MAG: acyltransferase [Bacteroidales bacterium]
MREGLPVMIFDLKDHNDFLHSAFEIFRLQSEYNIIYKDFIKNLGRSHSNTRELADLPFLPVELFRNHIIVTGESTPELIFESSRTTAMEASRHYVTDRGVYETSFLTCFRLFYGDPAGYLVAALLPSYAERRNSSLIYMTDRLIKESKNAESGFYRDNQELMISRLQSAASSGKKSILLGVSFALMDLAEKYSPDLSVTIIMETGGMKGRRKEITRDEMHGFLKTKFNVSEIHSEYGMTELMSQAYSKGSGIFQCPPWMRVMIRDIHDPLTVITEPGITGGINIIDLANINSCSFIATSDLGRLRADGGFEVLGRFDNSDVRGCNLLTG